MRDEFTDLETMIGGDWVEAVIFDLDGVITDTAEVHARAWKETFDGYLEKRAEGRGEPFRPFDGDSDYLRFVDGKPRYEGVRSFLESRGIRLDYGSPDDSPERKTICGIGNRKNRTYQEMIETAGVEAYPEAVELLRRLRSENVKTAVVTSSKNGKKVIASADIGDLFDVLIDGEISASRGLEGKPAPDIFLEAAAELKVAPDRAVVFEDALSGVEAGRRGAFGCVIGVDRTGMNPDLAEHGADRVVKDLSGIDFADLPRCRRSMGLPSALDHAEDIARWLNKGKAAVFLDYDGTLTPIVKRPEQANLSEEMRGTLLTLSRCCTVAVVSGRGLADVRERVGLEHLVYAGSHGFEIDGPDRERLRNEKGVEAMPSLDAAEQELHRRLADIEGVQVERKKFSIAVHYRNVSPEKTGAVADIVEAVLKRHDGLRRGQGKKVLELQPDVDWHKGHAVRWLMSRLGLDRTDSRPIYIGDDVTDEDAFRALRGRGLGFVVHGGEDRRTCAGFGLHSPKDVGAFLEILSARMDGGAKWPDGR
ncbi:MAG: trehalose-phosphatase [Desulfobacterales bacterium]